jgi:hypothetical protein
MPTKRLRRSLGALACIVALALPARPAHGDPGPLLLTDGDALSVDFSATPVCFAIPPALNERAPCPDLDPSRLASLSKAKLQFLAVGLVTLESGRKAMVSVGRTPSNEGPPAIGRSRRTGESSGRASSRASAASRWRGRKRPASSRSARCPWCA